MAPAVVENVTEGREGISRVRDPGDGRDRSNAISVQVARDDVVSAVVMAPGSRHQRHRNFLDGRPSRLRLLRAPELRSGTQAAHSRATRMAALPGWREGRTAWHSDNGEIECAVKCSLAALLEINCAEDATKSTHATSGSDPQTAERMMAPRREMSRWLTLGQHIASGG